MYLQMRARAHVSFSLRDRQMRNYSLITRRISNGIIWASNRLQLLQSRSRNMSRGTGTRGYALAGGRVSGTLGTELRVPTARNLHFIKTSRANRTTPEQGRGIIFALNPLRLIVPHSVIAFRTWPCKETIITMTFESI